MEIRILARRGTSIRVTEKGLMSSRNTVRTYLRAEAVWEVGSHDPGRPSKLAPHEDWLPRWVESAASLQLPATVSYCVFAAERYEHGSVILTSNLSFGRWERTFDANAALSSATLDRLLRHARVIQIRSDTYRLQQARSLRRRKLSCKFSPLGPLNCLLLCPF